MGRLDKFSSIQFYGQKIVAVELIHRGDRFEMTSITEREGSEDYSEIFASMSTVERSLVSSLADDFTSIRKTGGIDAPNVSICLDSRWVFIHSFPLDESFSESERTNHIAWELSNYLAPSKYEDYITGTARLEELAVPGTSLILSASARRDLISLFRQVVSRLNLHLAVIDVDHFGAEHALRWNYPEIEQETIALFGIKPSRVEATLFENGRSVQYQWREAHDEELAQNFLQHFLAQSSNGKSSPKKVYVYGEQANPSILSMLEKANSPTVEFLDPTRRVILPRRLRRMEQSTFQRYAPAIGIAMREQ